MHTNLKIYTQTCDQLTTYSKYFNSARKWHQEWSLFQYTMCSGVFYHSLEKAVLEQANMENLEYQNPQMQIHIYLYSPEK